MGRTYRLVMTNHLRAPEPRRSAKAKIDDHRTSHPSFQYQPRTAFVKDTPSLPSSLPRSRHYYDPRVTREHQPLELETDGLSSLHHPRHQTHLGRPPAAVMSAENELKCNNLKCRKELASDGRAVVTNCSRQSFPSALISSSPFADAFLNVSPALRLWQQTSSVVRITVALDFLV